MAAVPWFRVLDRERALELARVGGSSDFRRYVEPGLRAVRGGREAGGAAWALLPGSHDLSKATVLVASGLPSLRNLSILSQSQL